MSEDTNVKIHFIIDKSNVKKRVKWKDIKMMRKVKPGQLDDESLERVQVIACRFMADDQNNYLPLEQAYRIFDELSQEEAEEVINKFTAAFKEATIPNENGSQLKSTSEANFLTPPTSPTGSAS